MRGRFAGVLAALALATGLSVLATSAYARLAGYTFTILADNGPGSPFQSFYVPTMNARGEVVFAADLRSGGTGIHRWGGSPQALGTVFEEAVLNLRILGGTKPVSRLLPDPAVSPAGAFPGWPDSRERQAGPPRARAGRDGLGET
jgi:hypothetical protein